MNDSFSSSTNNPVGIHYPLTKAQQDIWLAVQLGGTSANAAYNESVSLDFDTMLDSTIIQQALLALSDRHEVLRATISSDGNNLCIMDSVNIDLTMIDLSKTTDKLETAIEGVIEDDIRQPFSLEDGPLIRAMLITLPQQRCRLVLNAHHIICDGWSYGILLPEFAQYYTAFLKGEAVSLDNAQSYQDYAQRNKENDDQNDLNYWLERHQNPAEELDFPTDFPRPAQRTYDADRVDIAISPELTQQLRILSREIKTTFFTLSYAAFCAYIARLSKAKDFSIGIPFAGQLSSGMTQLVGHCVNILPFRIQADSQQTLTDFVRVVADETGAGFDHPDLSFGSLVSELAINRDASRVPLIPITFNLDKNMGEIYCGDQLANISTNIRRYEPFDIAMNLVDRGDDMLAEWSFNTHLFSRATMTRRAQAFINFLQAIVDSPSSELWQLPIISDEEVATCQQWNNTACDTSDLLSIPDGFQQTANAHPTKVAIEYNDEKITYQEAQTKVNTIASALLQQGITENSLVALLLERSSDLPLSMLAVMQIGCAYVPLDPHQPTSRLVHILEDANVACMISNTDIAEELQALTGTLLPLATLTTAADTSTVRYPTISPQQLAYVIYTSGSTGKPKGVAVPHLGLSNIARSFQKQPGFTAEDKLLAITTAAFDIAALELLLPLVSGATVCVAGEKTAQDPQTLSQLIHHHDITVLQCVPTTWRLLLSYGDSLPQHLRGWCGGEALPSDLAAMATGVLKEFWNVYGPTETTIWSTISQVTENSHSQAQKPAPIGHPIDNTQIYILDEHKQQAPIGVSGMLWIGGAGVTAGYHNRNDLTAESFQENPYGDSVIYNTGDIARLSVDGELEYLGRQDFQVKIRGFRIELGDIESTLLNHQSVDSCVVHAVVDQQNNITLVAYIESNDASTIESSVLRDHLALTLPAYMIPSYFMVLDALPLNTNGKVDRSKLPNLTELQKVNNSSLVDTSNKHYIAPENDLEVTIASHFQKHLGLVKISMNDNFFESGGDSMSAVKLVVELNQELGFNLPLALLLHSPTPTDVVEKIQKDGGSSSMDSVVQLREQEDGMTVFCLMGIHIYASLANALGEGYNVYALLGKKENDFLKNMLAADDPSTTLDITGLADEYAELILSTDIPDPYHLVGFSSGGVVAIEVAKRLQAKGKRVNVVSLLDTILPRGTIKSKREWLKYHLKELGGVSKKLSNETKETPAAPPKAKKASIYSQDMIAKRGELLWQSLQEWDQGEHSYTGKVILFRATDLADVGYVQFKPGLGWEDILTQDFTIVDVPGNHSNLLNTDNAGSIAEHLHKLLPAI